MGPDPLWCLAVWSGAGWVRLLNSRAAGCWINNKVLFFGRRLARQSVQSKLWFYSQTLRSGGRRPHEYSGAVSHYRPPLPNHLVSK